MVPEEIIDFAKLLVKHVRDRAIKSCDVQLHAGNMNSPTAKRWRDGINSGNPEKLGEMIIPDCVDDTIFFLFEAIDLGILNITLNSPNGKEVNLTSVGLGELSGCYAGEWRTKFSSERYYDDPAGI